MNNIKILQIKKIDFAIYSILFQIYLIFFIRKIHEKINNITYNYTDIFILIETKNRFNGKNNFCYPERTKNYKL